MPKTFITGDVEESVMQGMMGDAYRFCIKTHIY